MKRMKRVISMLLAVVMFIAACPVSAFATTTDIAEEGKIETSSYNDYLYTLLSDGTISICGYTGSSESEQEGLYLEIPSSIDGMAVTQIAEEAFAYNEGIDTVVIPESVTVVGNSAFYHCSDLKAIVFYGTAPTFGFTAVEGSSSLEKIFTLNISDISAFCALLVNDLGEDHAKGVEIAEYESLDSLKKAYSEYIAAFDANIQTASGGDETVTMPGEEETLATAASEEETLATAASEEETLATAASEEETLATAVIEEETSATAANEDETQVTATPEETENTDSVLGNEDMPVTLDNTVDEAANTLVGILAEGICGDSLTWVLDVNGILTISGTGEMTNYSSGTAPWHSYSDKIKSLILSDGITSIGQYAFYNCTTLTGDLVIPDSVTSIGDNAFYGCSGFDGTLTLPDSVVSIGGFAFSGCSGLTGDLVIPDSVKTIGWHAFSGCSGFNGMLTLPAGLTSVETGVFSGCSGFNGTLTLPASLRSIGSSAFSGCSGFTGELVVHDGVTTLEAGVFSGMSGITSLVLGANLTKITTLGMSWEEDTNALYGMTGVTEVTFRGLEVPEISNSSYGPFDSMDSLETIYVPADAYNRYADAYKEYLPGTAEVESIETEGDFQIYGGILTRYLGEGGDVVIPDGVTGIGTSAFQNCEALTKVTVPGSVKVINSYAFEDCTGLREVVLSEGLETIGNDAFSGCTALESIRFPTTLESIDGFSGCTGLKSLELPQGLLSIGDGAFDGCFGLTGDLVIPDSVVSIGGSAFDGCSGLTGNLVIPDSVKTIGFNAFSGCSGFDGTLTLPDGLTSLGDCAFQNCSGFTGELVVPDGVTVLNRGVFSGMSGITSLVLGTNLTKITIDSSSVLGFNNNALYGMDSVTEITFRGLTVPEIYDPYSGSSPRSPFYSMDSLETIYVPADSYNSYVAAYSGYVSESVVFSSDFLHAKVANLKAASVYSKTVVLSWNPHTSERVVGYAIERDGQIVGTTTECTFTDRNLETDTSYTYSVYGYTADEETSGAAEITVTPCSPVITDIKTEHSFNKITTDNSSIYIYVKNLGNFGEIGSDSTSGKLYYIEDSERIFIADAQFQESSASSSSAVYTADWNIDAVEDGDYEIVFVFTDVDGTTVEYSETVSVDRSVPAQILGFTAISDISVIHLTWAVSSEVDTTIYRIYRRAESDDEFRLIAQINNRNTLTYTDSNVKTDRIYYYYVVGVNEFGQEGVPSEISGATLSDDTEAPVVTKLSPANAGYLTGIVTIGLTAQDNVSVTQANLYYSLDDGETWTPFGNAAADSFTADLDTTAFDDGEIQIRGIAYDAAGNESNGLTYVYRIDNTGPEQVKGLEFESTDVTITLKWKDVADNDISYYCVERRNVDGTYAKVTDVYSTLGANIYNLTPDSSYIYRVVGYDTQGNRGIPSEDITATTLGDTTAPVVTKLRPNPGYYSDSINLSVTAEDEYNVASITLQTSGDGTAWSDVYVKTYTDISKSRTLSYTLTLDSYEEGYLFVRALARDIAGNESDSSKTAPYVQHMVDKTAPAAPENVTATGNSGYIEVAWVQGSETDLNKYSVYRAESEDGSYELVGSDLTTINYIDRDVEDGVVYYYKIAVNDTAGNMSEFSDVVSAEIIKDTEIPVIVSVYPENGSSVGLGYKTVSVLATDNNSLSRILIEYSKDGNTYSRLYEMTDINTYSKTAAATIPVSEFRDGETVYIRVSATDKSGNQSESVTTRYIVDQVAPSAANVNAVYDDESVYISWTGNQEKDLIGYRIYRKTGATGSYSLIAQRQAVEGKTEYSCYDYNLSLTKAAYIYKIEAVDECGNTASVVTSEVEVPDRSASLSPTVSISCDSTMEVGVEYYIDALLSSEDPAIVSYLFDFGDGTTSTAKRPVHVYDETGEYTITLTVTDDKGNQASCTKKVTVKERTLIGTAKIRIVDENGLVVPGAPVYFDLGEEDQVIRTADGDGYVTFTAEVGKHTVGCVIADNEWLPVKKDIIITANEETSVSLTLIHHVMIEGMFEITRMTFEEIVAAGIDVSDPENQYMVKVNVTLAYGTETVETSFTYNETTGQTIARPTIVTTPDGEKRQIVPAVISTNKGSSGNTGGDYTFSSEATIAYLDIPVGVSALKDFFNVNLHIINNASSEFSMLDNVIQLNVPDGLTLVESYASESDPSVSIGEIKGQTTETITWILRGDEIGEYYLTADYSGILSEFNEPVYTQFIATDPIEVYGLSNLKLTLEIPEELDHGTFYYNVSLGNEGKDDVYRPNIDTGDTLIETQLFDAAGADVTDIVSLDAENIDDFGLATSIEGNLDVLPAGYRMTKHYMCVDQTSYTELEQKLNDYAYEMQNTYGLEIEIVTRPVSYFKSNLSANINAAEKAELTFTENRNAFEYLMNNENYIYWSMYASTGEVSTALTTNAQETLWDLLSFAAGDGSFKELFGLDDEELIQAIILDAMEISVGSEDYSKYYAMCDWTTLVKDWVEEEGYGEWINILTDWANENIKDLTKEQMEKLIDDFGKSLPRTFDLIITDYRWEAYTAIYEGDYLEFDNFIYERWKWVIKEEYYQWTEIEVTETTSSKLIHELFSKEGFAKIWRAMGFTVKAAQGIVTASEKTSTDISLYFIAQSNLDSCNLFLDTIINYMYTESGDAKKVVDAAKKIKEKINEMDLVGNLAENMLDEVFWASVDFAKDVAVEKLALAGNAFFNIVKAGLKLTVFIGNNVFNVDERHDIADNIRFVSCITIALRYGIWDAQVEYFGNRTDDTAQRYMQLISYLLNIRAIGESQVAQFGISYEVLPGVFDSSDLFYAVRDMSGAEDAASWLEWRDFVEDKIAMLRVQLLKNPLTTDVSGLSAPVVTFNYAAGQTAQTFSSDYEYSLNGGAWTVCDGSAIAVDPQPYSVELLVRRVDYSGSNEKMTGAVTIYPPPVLSGSSIRVVETEDGYRVENLDHERKYEVTIAQNEQSYQYGDGLDITIPDGCYSYEYATDSEYSYVYIRSVADANRYASYVFMPPIYQMSEISVEQEGQGTVTGAGCYEYGAEATLTAAPADHFEFDGWYKDGVLISRESVLTLEIFEDCTITAKFAAVAADWVIDTAAGFVVGIPEGTTVEDVIAYFQTENTKVTVTKADGTGASEIGTGYLLHIGNESYEIIIRGDVNGDSVIDIFDLYIILDYINSETTLTGAYFYAACVCQNEDIDIFDFYSELEYINSGSFAKQEEE